MNDSPLDMLSPDQVTLLTELAETENAQMEEAASPVTQQAFNLGCLVGLMPGGVFLLATLLLTEFSIIGAAIALVLILIGLIAFANLAAMFARRNTIHRVYRDQVMEQLETSLRDAGLNHEQFYHVARQVLPPQAALYYILPNPTPLRANIRKPGSKKGNQDDH